MRSTSSQSSSSAYPWAAERRTAIAASHPSRVERLVIVDWGPETIPAATSNISARLDPAQSFADPEEAIALLRMANPRAPTANLRERALYNLVTRPDGRWVWRYDRL